MLRGRRFSDSDCGKPLNSLAGHDPDGNISAAKNLVQQIIFYFIL
jgi:hypothetical protein